MSYELYKFMHLVSVILFFAVVARIFSTKKSSVFDVVLLHSSGFLILVGGMGLLARLNLIQDGSWPKWVTIKLAVWAFVYVVFGILAKRLKSKALPWYLGLSVLGLIAVYSAVFKPY